MRDVITLVLVLGIAGCAVSRAPLASTSPANPAAPSGRLAGAPATLRSGVVQYDLAPVRQEAPAEHHHHH
jgi:hypothetical protein